MKATVKRHYQVARSQISFIKFILEAYDNLAVLSTVDAAKGVILIRMMAGNEALVEQILDDVCDPWRPLSDEGDGFLLQPSDAKKGNAP